MSTVRVTDADRLAEMLAAEDTAEGQLNTYRDERAEGVYVDPASPAYVGANGRRIMLRAALEGLYVGGVLITDPGEALELAGRIEQWARGFAERAMRNAAPNSPSTSEEGAR